jgi:uncharacterized protein YaiI (UPF0178 family)
VYIFLETDKSFQNREKAENIGALSQIMQIFTTLSLPIRRSPVESSGMTIIYIDADACPVKEETYKVAGRFNVKVILVANSSMRIPLNALIEMQVVSGSFDAADDWIADNATKEDVVITTDILLADRCVKKAVRVLSPKGEEFTEDNVGSAVASRELMQNLRHMGEMRGGPAPMDAKARSKFLGKLDQILQAQKRLGYIK